MATEKRLIDANALITILEEITEKDESMYFHLDEITQEIFDTPTVDAVEVVHGRWVNTELGTLCTNCHRCFDPDFEIRRTVCRELKHCPECGADMRERKDK